MRLEFLQKSLVKSVRSEAKRTGHVKKVSKYSQEYLHKRCVETIKRILVILDEE